jgi:membrane protease YdiL (CAAX protease family)
MAARNVIKGYPVATFFGLAYGITWIGIFLLLGPGGIRRGELPARQFLLVWGLMLLGPGIAGPLLTGLVEGRAGLRAFLGRMTRWRVGLRWYATLLIVPLLAGAILAGLSLASPAFNPGIMSADNKVLSLVLFLVASFGAAVEELGWTGFATPHLRARHSVLATGLTVGMLWGTWHLLSDLGGNLADYGALYPLRFLLFWFVALTAFRVLIVWVYDYTGSLLLAQLMHASYTGSLVVLGPADASVAQNLLYQALFAAALCAVVAFLVLPVRRGVGRQVRAQPA